MSQSFGHDHEQVFGGDIFPAEKRERESESERLVIEREREVGKRCLLKRKAFAMLTDEHIKRIVN